MKASASTFVVGWRSRNAEMYSAKTIMMRTASTMAAIMIHSSSVSPTAVRIESSENTASNARTWTITPAKEDAARA